MYLMEGKKLLDANVFDGRQKIAKPIVKLLHQEFVISRLLISTTASIWFAFHIHFTAVLKICLI